MTKQTIQIGSAPNDHTGDPLRVAFTKVNDNFTELYDGVTQAAVEVIGGDNDNRTVLDVTKRVHILSTDSGAGINFRLPDGVYDGQEITFVQHDGQDVNIFIDNLRAPNNSNLYNDLAWYPFIKDGGQRTTIAKTVWAIDAWHIDSNNWD